MTAVIIVAVDANVTVTIKGDEGCPHTQNCHVSVSILIILWKTRLEKTPFRLDGSNSRPMELHRASLNKLLHKNIIPYFNMR